MSVVFGIDPGPKRSAIIVVRDGVPRPDFAIYDNEDLLGVLRGLTRSSDGLVDVVVIEKIESFGMAVGADVFETVFWSGRFAEAAYPLRVERIGRMAVKMALCHNSRAKDANIRQALIDRFGGLAAIGRKANPGPLYGVAGDVWSALAVAVTWADRHSTERVA